MGRPTASFRMQPVQTEVRYFKRSMAAPLWLGLDDGRLVWLRFGVRGDRWLEDTTRRMIEAPEANQNGEMNTSK